VVYRSSAKMDSPALHLALKNNADLRTTISSYEQAIQSVMAKYIRARQELRSTKNELARVRSKMDSIRQKSNKIHGKPAKLSMFTVDCKPTIASNLTNLVTNEESDSKCAYNDAIIEHSISFQCYLCKETFLNEYLTTKHMHNHCFNNVQYSENVQTSGRIPRKRSNTSELKMENEETDVADEIKKCIRKRSKAHKPINLERKSSVIFAPSQTVAKNLH
jgi:exonuclease VII large subunit